MNPLSPTLSLALLSACSVPSGGSPERRRDDGNGVHHSAQFEQIRLNTPYGMSKGEMEVDAVIAVTNNRDVDELRVKLEFEYGVTDDLFVELEIPGAWIDDGPTEGGVSDIDFEVKHSLPQLRALRLDTAIGVEISVPTGDHNRGLGSGEIGWEFYGTVARDFGAYTAYSEFQIDLEEGGKEAFSLNTAVQWRCGHPHSSFLLALDWDFAHGEGSALSLIPALATKLGDVEVGIGIPIGLNSEAQDWGLITKFAVEF